MPPSASSSPQFAITNFQVSIFNSLPLQQFIGASTQSIITHWHNPGSSPLTLNLRARLYQATTSTAALLSDTPWKSLSILPGQTIIESASIPLPDVRAETRFFIQWTTATNTIAGTTEFLVYPANLLTELRALAEDQPVGLFDPQKGLKSLFQALGLPFDDLEQSGLPTFTGKLVIIAPGSSHSDTDLRASIKTAARYGAGIVWITSTRPQSQPLRPSFCIWPEGKGMIVLAQDNLVPNLAHNPQSQLNLVQLARLASRRSGPTCADQFTIEPPNGALFSAFFASLRLNRSALFGSGSRISTLCTPAPANHLAILNSQFPILNSL